LTADVASVERTLSNKVKHLFMGVRIILDSWSHADDDSPRRIGSENEHRVINSSELGMHDGFHLVPLIHFKSVVGDRCGQVGCGVTMKTITIRELRLVVLTIWLNK
jgi:hypothetical protein